MYCVDPGSRSVWVMYCVDAGIVWLKTIVCPGSDFVTICVDAGNTVVNVIASIRVVIA
jgi:hypothetical protein